MNETDTRERLERSLRPYADAGWGFVPLRGKIPARKDWPNRPMPMDEAVEWVENRGENVGAMPPEGWLVLDLDVRAAEEPEHAEPQLEDFARTADLDLGSCPTVFTGRGDGSRHVFIRVPDGFRARNRVKDRWPALEFKGYGRQVVAAGGIHPSTGGEYGWDPLGFVELPDAPVLGPLGLEAIQRQTSEGTSSGSGEINAGELEGLLAQVDPCSFDSDDTWFSLLCGAHFATGGCGQAREVFLEWSAGDPAYGAVVDVNRARWNSLDPHAADAIRTPTFYALLADAAKESGATLQSTGTADLLTALEDEGELAPLPPLTPEEAAVQSPAEEQESKLESLNQEYSFVLQGGVGLVARRTVAHDGARAWDFLSTTAFKDRHAMPRLTPAGGSPMGAGRFWMDRYPQRRTFDGMELFPDEAPGALVRMPDGRRVMNLWEGLQVQPALGDCSMVLDYVARILADGDRGSFWFLLRWMALLVQRPAYVPEVALVFMGGQGTGKSFLCEHILGPVVGPAHHVSIADPDHIFGKFNIHTQAAILISLEEAVWGGNRKNDGKLKDLISATRRTFEPKNGQAFNSPNLAHVVMTSNEDLPAHLDSDDRRFGVFRVSDAEKQNRAYFSNLAQQLEGGQLAAFLDLLLGVPLDAVDPLGALPDTRARRTLKLDSLPPLPRWWAEVLAQGWMDHVGEERTARWEVEPVVVDSVEMARMAEGQLPNRFGERAQATQKVGRMLNRYMAPPPGSPFGDTFKVRSQITEEDGTKAQAMRWHLPPLQEARALFEAEAGPVDWE